MREKSVSWNPNNGTIGIVTIVVSQFLKVCNRACRSCFHVELQLQLNKTRFFASLSVQHGLVSDVYFVLDVIGALNT